MEEYLDLNSILALVGKRDPYVIISDTSRGRYKFCEEEARASVISRLILIYHTGTRRGGRVIKGLCKEPTS